MSDSSLSGSAARTGFDPNCEDCCDPVTPCRAHTPSRVSPSATAETQSSEPWSKNDPHSADIEWRANPGTRAIGWRGRWAEGCIQESWSGDLSKWVITPERVSLWHKLQNPAPSVEAGRPDLAEEIRAKEARLRCAVEMGAYGPVIDAWISELETLRSRSPSSPVPSSETDLEKMLIEHERLCMEDLRAAFIAKDAARAIEPVTTRILASRKAILESVPSSPPSRGSEEELGKLLGMIDYWEGVAIGFALRHSHPDYPDTETNSRELAAAKHQLEELRQRVESYVSRLRDERDAAILAEIPDIKPPITSEAISDALDRFERAGIERSIIRNAQGSGRFSEKMLIQADDFARAARIHLEELFLASDRMTRYWMRETERRAEVEDDLIAALASLKEQHAEQKQLIEVWDAWAAQNLPDFGIPVSELWRREKQAEAHPETLMSSAQFFDELRAKLRLLSTSDSET